VRTRALHDVVVAARQVATLDPLHLDDPRAEVCEVAGGEWCRHGLLEGDDGDALQRKAHDRFFAARTSPPPMMSRWISLVPS